MRIGPLIISTAILSVIGMFLVWNNINSSVSVSDSADQSNSQINTDGVKRIQLQTPQGTVELLQNGSEWHVKQWNFEANSEKIQKLFLALLDLKLGDLVTENPEKHHRLRLEAPPTKGEWNAEKHAVAIHLFQQGDTPITTLLLGKERPNGEGQYIRFADQNQVYVIPESILVDENANDWLAKELLSLNDAPIAKIRLERASGDIFEFSRKADTENEWDMNGLEEGQTFDSYPVQQMIRQINDLELSDLKPLDSEPTTVGRTKQTRFVASLEDGRSIELNLGEESADDTYWMQISISGSTDNQTLQQQMDTLNQKSKSWLFAIPTWTGNAFLKNKDDFLKKE